MWGLVLFPLFRDRGVGCQALGHLRKFSLFIHPKEENPRPVRNVRKTERKERKESLLTRNQGGRKSS